MQWSNKLFQAKL